MSEKYDNWDRLVAAVLKRELIWKLCHQDSVSTIFSQSSSSSLRFANTAPLSLGSYVPEFDIKDIFISVRSLGRGEPGASTLAQLQLDVQVSDQPYLAAGTKAVTKKLLKTDNIAEHEFEQQMAALGNCRHENVGTPWAYYFSETTKIIVYHHYSQGSVFDLLQARWGLEPKWESRLRIAVGVARGIAHIHKQCGGEMVHGNIKSSNIFLNSQGYGIVSDFGLAAGILEEHGPSQESDVYNFGVVLLEICTRKEYIDHHLGLLKASARDLRRFVRGKLLVDELDMLHVRSALLFAEDLTDSVVKEKFLRTFDVAMNCLASFPGDRPTMAQVVSELDDMLHPPQVHLSNQDYSIYSQHSNKSEDKKRGWNRFLPFGR